MPEKSLIPLNEKNLNTLMDNMYTARFVVEGGRAARYSEGPSLIGTLIRKIYGTYLYLVHGERAATRYSQSFNLTHSDSPPFPGVPDGTYEFYYGKGYQIGWGGILHELPADHPLMARTPENIVKLYNLGIELDLSNPLPNRYAYFRNGDLYLLGAPLLKKGDPLLVQFEEDEQKKSAAQKDYLPFLDAGAPTDAAFIKNFGLKIPEKHYLVLGDNHAMSSDSRVFGFVPEANLQGVPSLILWPAGERWGFPNGVPYQLFPLSRLIVWALAAAGLGGWWYWNHRRLSRPIV